MAKKTLNPKSQKKKISIEQNWPVVKSNAAGIDLGSREHWVAVPSDRDEQPVRSFKTFTADLESLAQWLHECGVTSVAMEATGVYWIPLFQILERRGFEVLLVNARQIKNVTGRKSDVMDCQWIQRLHTYGLLGASFRPADPYCVLRSYLRYRDELVAARTTQTQHMQKALQEMNIQLNQVLSNIVGVSGLAIIEALLNGERNPLKLAGMANHRVKASQGDIAKALVGDYRIEHLFVLKAAFDLYHVYERQIAACDEELIRELGNLPDKITMPVEVKSTKPPKADDELRAKLHSKLGVDLTAVEGIGCLVALTMLCEVGLT